MPDPADPGLPGAVALDHLAPEQMRDRSVSQSHHRRGSRAPFVTSPSFATVFAPSVKARGRAEMTSARPAAS